MTSGDPTVDAGVLFRQHAAFVAGFLIRVGLAREELDDAVQEVFMIAHRRGGFRPGAAQATTWLAEIAIRIASNRRRSKRRARVEADDEVVARAASEQSLANRVEARESLARVNTALDDLDDDKRLVFVLFELHGKSCKEIAAGLGIAIGTVYSRLHEARKRFMASHARMIEGASADAAATGGAL